MLGVCANAATASRLPRKDDRMGPLYEVRVSGSGLAVVRHHAPATLLERCSRGSESRLLIALRIRPMVRN